MMYKLKIHKSRRKIILIIISTFIVAGLIGLTITPLTNHEVNQTYNGKDVGEKMVLIIPGLNETEDKYRQIEGYYSDVGITPIFIDMDWKITSFFNFIEHGSGEIEKVVSLYPDRDIYIFGFSFGAVIALINAGKYESKGTLICSLSPIFQENFKLKPYWLKAVTQLTGFSPPNYRSIPEQSTVFLQGDHDNSRIISDEIMSMRERLYPKSKFKIIEGAEHDITGDAYQEEIKKEIYKLREEANE